MNEERSGWRDAALSARHRRWGKKINMVDLDFMAMEFYSEEPLAVIEFKHRRTMEIRADFYKGRYNAMRNLCDGYHRADSDGKYRHKPLHCLVAIYDAMHWTFDVIPLNDVAEKFYAHCRGELLTERRFVKSLYAMRKSALSQEDMACLEMCWDALPAPSACVPMQLV